MKGYFYIEPEVAGGLGPKTMIDRSTHPPIVTTLHHVFEGWLGDPILETFPTFICTLGLQRALVQFEATGIEFDDVEVATSDTFDQMHPILQLPMFRWLKITGRAGCEDFGLSDDFRLVISSPVWNLMQSAGTTHATVEAFAIAP